MKIIKAVISALILFGAVHLTASPHMLIPSEKPAVHLLDGWIFTTAGGAVCGPFVVAAESA